MALRSGLSVLVAAPTGTGKTLIAEKLLADVLTKEKGAIYTSPVKALSNQKYRDFGAIFGRDKVGLITGDFSINERAPVLVMTTEIFRNWCFDQPDDLQSISHVVFDEMHYLDDPVRGTVWEESIIFAPSYLKFLGLSATIPNIYEIAAWIKNIRHDEVKIIVEKKRAVPLKMRWINHYGNILTAAEAQTDIKAQLVMRQEHYRRRMNKVLINIEPQATCTEVIEVIQEYLPALYFTFGRKRTELQAEELGRQRDFLNLKEKQEVRKYILKAKEENPGLFSLRRGNLRRLLYQGIGYHHAGLAPTLKNLVERLYESRLIYVLFCTETFAVGVNFPAASTVFDSCRKWDGQEFRNLNNREFFQMVGRSGRRGYDETGQVFVCLDKRFPEQTVFYTENKVEPVKGRLIITPNTVLNLLHWKTEAEIKKFLKQNLAVYQNTKETRQIKQELLKLEDNLAKQEEVFCTARLTPCCQLQRLKLRQELNYLSRRKNRHCFKVRERKKVIYSLLQSERKKCNDKKCCQAEKKIRTITEKINFFNRQIDSLRNNCRGFEQEFTQVLKLLQRLDFVKDRKLLPRGLFALNVHVQEILVTELIFSGFLLEIPLAEAAAILAGVDYQPGRDERIEKGNFSLKQVTTVKKYLLQNGVPEHFCLWSPLPGALTYAWYEGVSFATLMQLSNLQEGDIFSLLRREIDLLRQIERAAGDDLTVVQFTRNLRRKLDRDEIAITGF